MDTENRKQAIKLISDCVDNIIKLTAIPKISDGQRSQCHNIINRLNNLTVNISVYKEDYDDAREIIDLEKEFKVDATIKQLIKDNKIHSFD